MKILTGVAWRLLFFDDENAVNIVDYVGRAGKWYFVDKTSPIKLSYSTPF